MNTQDEANRKIIERIEHEIEENFEETSGLLLSVKVTTIYDDTVFLATSVISYERLVVVTETTRVDVADDLLTFTLMSAKSIDLTAEVK